VTIELAKRHLDQLRERGQLGELGEMIRAKVESEAFPDYESRASDLFTQLVCREKLDLAIEAGIGRENHTIAAETFVEALDRGVVSHVDAIHRMILTELDL
jgi:hypothetical protein